MKNNLEVKWAVIPCAGKGTRFLPITKGVAKEMLNIIDRPTIDYIVDELVDSGIENIVFIVSKGKDEIKKYYDKDEAFVEELNASGKQEFSAILEKNSAKAHYFYKIQEEQLGLGHAVLQAKEIIKDNNFVVCCGDDITLYDKKNPPIKQLIEGFKKTGGTIVGGQKVPHENIKLYGAMEIGKEVEEGLFSLKGIVEKPKVEEAPSDYASLGKWIFKPNIFEEIEHTPKGKGGEIQLTDAIALLMKKEEVYFQIFDGRRYDCGNKAGFLEAIIDVALTRDDLKDEVMSILKEKVK